MGKVEVDTWVNCPAGELQRLEKRLWLRRVRRFLLIAAGVLLTAGVVSAGAWQVGHAIFAPARPAPTRCPGSCPAPAESGCSGTNAQP